MDPSATEKYWCGLDQDAFAKEYFARIAAQSGFQGFGELCRLQRLANRHYYGALPANFVGEMPSSAEATRAGDQGENVEVRVNWFHAHVNAKHQIIVAPKLAWGTQATNTDARSMADASRGGSILEYLWKSGAYEAMAISAELGAVLSGEEFLFTLWNPKSGKPQRFDKETGEVQYEGDVDCYAIPSCDVLRQQDVKSFQASPWLSVRLSRNRWDLIAQYPDMRDEVLAIPAQAITNNATSVTATSNPDTVVAHYFFHRKSPALPRGLQAVLLSANCVLEFRALEPCYQHLPVHRFRAKELKGTPYAYTSAWEGMGIQDLATDAQGSLATNITVFAKQMISAESDQNLNVNQIGNGPTVVYRAKGSPEPQPINLLAPSPEMFKHLDRLKADQRMVLGLNDMALGEPPQGPPNAQAWALLATANITNNSDEQRGFIDGVRSVGRSLLAIIKAKFDTKRKAAIVGKYGAAVPEQDSFDKSNFQGIDDVTVDIDNPLMQTAAGRMPIAQMYLDMGFVQVPEQIQQLVTTGTLKPMTQTLENETNHVAWENEQFLLGINPPVMISDSHQLHIREHKDATFIPDGRNNPAAIEAFNAHIQQHTQLALNTDPRVLALFGQAVPAPAMPPGPGGPPGGGPDALKQAAPALLPPGAPAQGEVKLPTAPVNPATGSPTTPPGGLQ